MIDLAQLTSATFPGRWSALAPLADGMAGTVYRATAVDDGRVVALKVFVDDSHAPPLPLPRVPAHPGVVTLLGAGRIAHVGFVTMALVPGATVDAVVATGALAPGAALAIIAQLADALAHLHGHGVVHGALQPEHVLIDDGRACIVSLDGAPVRAQQAARPNQRVCRGRGAMISIRTSYSPPERLLRQPSDHRADLYALGLLAFALVTGRDAFVADDELALMRLVARGPTPSLPPALAADAGLVAWFARAVAREPAERFQTAAELGAATRALLGAR